MTSSATKATKPIYPDDWPRIAYEAKQAANWTCRICHSNQQETPSNIITVHHKDHNTFNNDPSNLDVLCQICHLRLEGAYRRLNNYLRKLGLQLSQGQTILPGFTQFLS